MKENSIERDIHLLESYAGMTHKMNDNQGRPKLDQAIEHILSDYKRVLKENQILKKEKEQAWEEWNNLEQGSYETEQKLKQQIKESQRENEELKNQEETARKVNELLVERYSTSIPVQKVKEKIEELGKEEKRELKGTKGQDRYYIKQKYMYKRKVLEDLLREDGVIKWKNGKI